MDNIQNYILDHDKKLAVIGICNLI
jgi:hypothetical protein